jgi:DNA polymerase III delta prime subunit
MEKKYPEGTKRFKAAKAIVFNVLGEIFGKLHFEDNPIKNACSERMLQKMGYDFDKTEYDSFKEAFEDFKKSYLEHIGKLSPKSVAINMELDEFFNFFDKDENAKKFLERVRFGEEGSGESVEMFKLTDEQIRKLKGWNDAQTDEGYFLWYDSQKQNSKEIREILQNAKFKEGKDLSLKELYRISRLLTENLGGTALRITGKKSIFEMNPLETVNARLRNLLFGEGSLVERVDKFIDLKGVRIMTVSQFLCLFNHSKYAFFADFMKDVLRSKLSIDETQFKDAEDQAEKEFRITPEKYQHSGTRDYFTYFVILREIKNVLSLESYLQVQNLLWRVAEGEVPTTIEVDFLRNLKSLLEGKKQIVLYGPPGTGKTYEARVFAAWFLGGTYEELHENGQIEFITFHPSYSYEEFVEGITVNTEPELGDTESGEIRYIHKWGTFKKICTIALARAINENLDSSKEPWEDQWSSIYAKYKGRTKDKSEEINNELWKNAEKFVLIIDEINRGDTSKIFGELVTLLENDKRLAQENEIIVQLPYSNDKFGVPPNIYIIGTMNTADRSIALVDIALRRRFGFVEMAPDFEVLMSEHIEKNKQELQKNNVYEYLIRSVEAVKKINGKIVDELGRDKQIGHSFFFRVFNQKDLMMVWQYEILPLLEEYYYCDYDKILRTLGVKSDNPYVNKVIGIRGFKKIEELAGFLQDILGVIGT